MDNDFFNQLNQSCKSKEEIEKERKSQQQKIDAENNAKIQQAKDKAKSEYDRLVNLFIDELKTGAINAVSKGCFIETGHKKLLKGVFELSENVTLYDCSEDTTTLVLSYQFYKPQEKSIFLLVNKTTWEKDIITLCGGVTLYKGLPSVNSDYISPYDKFLRQKFDKIKYNDDLYLEIKKYIPTLKCKNSWKHVRNSWIIEFSFEF